MPISVRIALYTCSLAGDDSRLAMTFFAMRRAMSTTMAETAIAIIVRYAADLRSRASTIPRMSSSANSSGSSHDIRLTTVMAVCTALTPDPLATV